MDGMALGIMVIISGTPGRVHTVPVTMCTTQDHRRLSMSNPLLPSLEFSLARNPNPFTPSPHLQAYPANSTLAFKQLGKTLQPFHEGGLLNNYESGVQNSFEGG